jgi:hypothetical protein
MSATIVGPSGNTFTNLSPARSWKEPRSIGQFSYAFHWLDADVLGMDADEDAHPCLCIYPVGMPDGAVPYIIPQRNMFAYADSKSGDPSPWLLGAAFKACMTFNTFPSKATVRKLCDLVVEALPDLQRMPSSRPSEQEVAAPNLGIEATIKLNGQTFKQAAF